MPLEEIKIWPLLCGVLLGVYLVALAVVVVDRQKKKKKGHSLAQLGSASSVSVFLAMFFPVWIIFGSGAYFSATLGGVSGAMACTFVLLIKRKPPNQTPEPTAPSGRGSS